MSIFHRHQPAEPADILWVKEPRLIGLEPIEDMTIDRRRDVATDLFTLVQSDESLLVEFPRFAETYASVHESRVRLEKSAVGIAEGTIDKSSCAIVWRNTTEEEVAVRGFVSVTRQYREKKYLPGCIDPEKPYAELSAWMRPNGDPEEYESIFKLLISDTRFQISPDVQVFGAVMSGSPKEQALIKLRGKDDVDCQQPVDLGKPIPNVVFDTVRDVLVLPREVIEEFQLAQPGY